MHSYISDTYASTCQMICASICKHRKNILLSDSPSITSFESIADRTMPHYFFESIFRSNIWLCHQYERREILGLSYYREIEDILLAKARFCIAYLNFRQFTNYFITKKMNCFFYAKAFFRKKKLNFLPVFVFVRKTKVKIVFSSRQVSIIM